MSIQINIFHNITENKLFLVIVISILGLQTLLVTFTGSAFHVYSNYGLTLKQWGICIAIGSLAIPLNLILKFIEIKEVDVQDKAEEQDPTQQEMGTAFNMVSKDEKLVQGRTISLVASPATHKFRSPD